MVNEIQRRYFLEYQWNMSINEHPITAWWWLEPWLLYDFPYIILGTIIPLDELIFFRGVGIPPTSHYEHRVSTIPNWWCMISKNHPQYPHLNRSQKNQRRFGEPGFTLPAVTTLAGASTSSTLELECLHPPQSLESRRARAPMFGNYLTINNNRFLTLLVDLN